MSRVCFVGSGPGGADLLTVRARGALDAAEAVVHPPGLAPAIVACVPQGSLRVETDAAHDLASLARKFGVVVRLYEGDPLFSQTFGDEARRLEAAGIPYEVIPGVPTQIAAAAFAGLIADPEAGIVLASQAPGRPEGLPAGLMTPGGNAWVSVSPEDVSGLLRRALEGGVDPGGPVAIVSRPGAPEQQVLRGTLAGLGAGSWEGEAPVVAVFGETCKPENSLHWLDNKPLFGKKILVTRAAHQVAEFSGLIRERWGIPVELPLIELRPCGHKSVVDAALRRLFAYDWVVFTSVNAVEFTFRRLEELQLDARCFGAARVCAVGPKTADALERRGIRADAVPEEFVAESLVEALGAEGSLRGSTVLLPRAREAREVLPEQLQERGARVDVLPLYENVRPESHPAAALDALAAGAVDVVTLASSSAARNYEALCREQGLDSRSVPCAAIGPATRETAEQLGLPVCAVANRYTLEGLLDALEGYFRGE